LSGGDLSVPLTINIVVRYLHDFFNNLLSRLVNHLFIFSCSNYRSVGYIVVVTMALRMLALDCLLQAI
jgi:hypothetical protein